MARDLLAGLLPAGDPFAPFDPQAYRAAIQASAPQASSLRESPLQENPLQDNPAQPSTEMPDAAPPPLAVAVAVADEEPPLAAAVSEIPDLVTAPIVVERPTFNTAPAMGGPGNVGQNGPSTGRVKKRRRRSLAGPLMAVFALLMFAGIAGCLYLLVSGKGLTTDGRLIATAPNEGPQNPRQVEPFQAEPAASEVRPKPDFDPVMGNLKPANNNSPPPNLDPQKPTDNAPEIKASVAPEAEPSQPNMPDSEDSGMVANMDSVEEMPTDGKAPAGDMNPAAEMQPAKDEKLATATKALEALEGTLRSGRFDEMKSAVEQARPAMVTEPQKTAIAQYALLVELADYYVEGIRRGADNLSLGEAFDISPGFTVGVVEGSREKVALKIGGRTKSYTFDQLPLALAHRLAGFALPESEPEVVAGRAAYQSLWSKATPAHRQQALDWLDRPGEDSDRFSMQAVSAAIARLFD